MGFNEIALLILGIIVVIIFIYVATKYDWSAIVKNFLPSVNTTQTNGYETIGGTDEVVPGEFVTEDVLPRFVKPGEENLIDVTGLPDSYGVSTSDCYGAAKKYCIIHHLPTGPENMDYYFETSSFNPGVPYTLFKRIKFWFEKDTPVCNIKVGEYTSKTVCLGVFPDTPTIKTFMLTESGEFIFQELKPEVINEPIAPKSSGNLIINS